MTNPFEEAIKRTIGVEGGYSDRPDDPGGKTRFGITEKVARAEGYTGDMAALPVELANAIYWRLYWEPLHLTSIALLSIPVALEMFDTAVNCGIGTEAGFLQRALNSFNTGDLDCDLLKIDYAVGAATVATLAAFLKKRGAAGETVLLRALNGLQFVRYLEIVEGSPKHSQATSMFGWVLQRVS